MAINNVSLVSQPDMAAQQSALERQRRMAEALQQQAMTPDQGQNVSGIYVAPNIMQHAAKLAQALVAKRSFEDADKQQVGLSQQANQRTADILKSFAPKGLFDEGATEAKTEGAGFTQPKFDSALKQKWEQALSIYQANPTLGGKLIEGLTAEDEFSTTPQYDQNGNAYVLSKRGGPPKYLENIKARDKFENVNGVWKNPYAQAENSLAPQNPNQPFAMGPNGPVPNTAYQSYQVSKARAGAPSVAVNTEKTYAGNMAEGIAKQDLSAIDAARGASARIENARRIKEVLGTNPITGTGAEARLSLNKMLSTAGLIDGTQTKNTEDLAALLAAGTLDAIQSSGLGAGQGFTNTDRQFLERARSGNIEINAGTLRMLADLNERAGMIAIKRGNEVAGRLKNNPAFGSIGQGLEFSVPDSPKAPLSKSEQDELQQLRKRFGRK
jgi:hypothetical protein